jgi:hypothetical protein
LRRDKASQRGRDKGFRPLALQGKVLVIDEAYALDDSMYGREALNTLTGRVNGKPGEDIAVILCG